MSLRHAVLGLLVEHPASGYDLLRQFEQSLANVWPATQSQLYGELAKLAADEQVTVSAEGPRGRKEYAITDAGRAELRRWLLEERPRRRRDDLLLRVFFLGTVTPEEARGFMERGVRQMDQLEEELRAVEQHTDWGDNDLSVYGRIALEWGLRYAAMHREWARWAEKQLR
ncbi:helix-turn-helix transcriptional regulator [Kribbella jejuensis]|uniref:DNA-binding PadR family transcriptional regulator n=1 Tax=Kribbella jejuensis TaxID=236068 RepID=A0A542EAU4_9ACTN|nr:PadR family transcriptional regulator [Kribbella jejuensis]TQJ12452.1 DNA-binding PadR family transcriptional regulator [Kribbella jejuensis]